MNALVRLSPVVVVGCWSVAAALDLGHWADSIFLFLLAVAFAGERWESYATKVRSRRAVSR